MTRFRYTALAEDGTEVTGVLRAQTGGAVRDSLGERDLRLVDLKEKKGLLRLQLTAGRVPRQEIVHLSGQLAAFMRSGVPILDAIEVIREETANSRLREVLADVAESLRRGEPLSEALTAHRAILPPYYIHMVRSAEMTGRLDTVLDQLARYIERDLEARRKIRSALAYPSVVFAMSLATAGILTVFVLPRFRKFFESLDATLPLPTRILLAASGFIGTWWWAILLATVAMVAGVVLLFRTPRGGRFRDTLLLRLPIAGEVARFAIIERFCRILASIVQAGVSLPEGMALAARGTSNVVYQEALEGVRDAMLRGDGLAVPLARTRLFPASVVQMVRVGEGTGTLDQQLEAAAAYHERELDYKIKRLTSLFEPAVIIAMGLLVGFVAVALVSAMYGIFRQAGSVR